ncbi:hypothetical protein NRL09_10480 [Aeromonas caviae]|uniref:hypothetical protein n=1 Tax=Aeromonas caviae TaxID=648 RepID=UPI0024CC9AA8|nr:hypothetical protein NRL03_10460 [Aeromonas caviae]WAF66183.1 hypothetical protein NRL19_10495 [Aeromonas caviae]WAF83009.1 hypothetical protein NRL09_10480 [Aeromonas caviae]
MDIKQWARWLANKLIGVLWFIVRNPFLIIKRVIRWTLIAVFWLFLLGWGISAFAIESAPAKSVSTYKGLCSMTAINSPSINGLTLQECIAASISTLNGKYSLSSPFRFSSSSGANPINIYYCDKDNICSYRTVLQNTTSIITYACPPDGKPNFTSGPIDINGTKVCQTRPITCKMGEIKTVASTNGVETCKENCASVSGQGLADQGESVNILLNFTQFFETRIEYRFQIFTAHSCDFLLPSYARLA